MSKGELVFSIKPSLAKIIFIAFIIIILLLTSLSDYSHSASPPSFIESLPNYNFRNLELFPLFTITSLKQRFLIPAIATRIPIFIFPVLDYGYRYQKPFRTSISQSTIFLI